MCRLSEYLPLTPSGPAHAPGDYSAATVNRAKRAASWIGRYIEDEVMKRIIIVCIACIAAGHPVERTMKRKGWAQSTVRKKKAQGLSPIAAGLNQSREPFPKARVFHKGI